MTHIYIPSGPVADLAHIYIPLDPMADQAPIYIPPGPAADLAHVYITPRTDENRFRFRFRFRFLPTGCERRRIYDIVNVLESIGVSFPYRLSFVAKIVKALVDAMGKNGKRCFPILPIKNKNYNNNNKSMKMKFIFRHLL
ncbi:hypothetical protein CRG98_014366 [Punica granatum]|uniref:E2F/DP family winged-helix DNA-binding domain-containing protein n=1 Tax=Punica granatum TaxID=22663 RepID=A0A2I0K9J2_PUNGR|nr:hypothetical protein CRG98_014366 [Punica granatum]